MRTVGSVLVVFVCTLIVFGCRPEQRGVTPTAPLPPPPVQPQVSTEQQTLLEDILEYTLEEILEYTKDTGSTLEQLAEEARRREQLEQAASGVDAIDDDLRVAQALVAAIAEAAADEAAAAAATALERLRPTLTVLRSELPAAAIAQHLERALAAISSLAGQEAANAASSSLLAAMDTAMQAPAPLVPEVVEAVEGAKSKVDDNELAEAKEQILEILDKLQGDEAVKLLDSALAGMQGAAQALDREAWPVLVAELDQLEAMLSQLQEKVGETAAEAAEAEEPEQVEETEEATAEEPTESGARAEEEAPAERGPAARTPGRAGRGR